MQEKELLRRLGEETLYSAKGHFKSCDLRRKLITNTIWLCARAEFVTEFDMNDKTAQRRLASLVKRKLIAVRGKVKATVYVATK